MNECIVIREAQGEDAEALLAYLKTVGGETDNLTFGAEGVGSSVDAERAFLEGTREAPESVFFVALDEGEIVGVGNLAGSTRPRLAHRAELGISVRRSHWHRGIGTRLLSALLEFAREANLRIVSLYVRSDNTRAIALYERFDFEKAGRFEGFEQIDDELVPFDLMVLKLNWPKNRFAPKSQPII